MKSFLQALLFFLILSLISVKVCHAQQYVMKGNDIVKVEKSETAKAPDKVVATKDGITFYQGPKGGVYYWKTSKKTGKPYKCYLKK